MQSPFCFGFICALLCSTLNVEVDAFAGSASGIISLRAYKNPTHLTGASPQTTGLLHSCYQLTAKKTGLRGFSASQSNNVLSDVGKVLGTSSVGFDSKMIMMPVVRRYVSEEGENWRMWYNGRDTEFDSKIVNLASGRIGLCESNNGLSWQRVGGEEALGSCFGPNPDWWAFDTTHVGVGDVQILSSSRLKNSEKDGSGVNFLFYFGGDAEEGAAAAAAAGADGGVAADGKGARMRIGVALSYDGTHWSRMEGDHHSGAVFDVGPPGTWDSEGTGWPTVVQHGPGDYRMYYSSWDAQAGQFLTGIAVSGDGFKWKKGGKLFGGGPPGAYDAKGCRTRCVVQSPDGRGYLMFAEGISDDWKSSIGLFSSPDGFEWTRASDGPILSAGEEGAWDSDGVAGPSAVVMDDGTCRLYYAGRSAAGWAGVGLAESTAPFAWTRFRRHGAPS